MSANLDSLSWIKTKQDNNLFFDDQIHEKRWTLIKTIDSGACKKIRILSNERGELFCLLTPSIRDFKGEKLSLGKRTENHTLYLQEKRNWENISRLNLEGMAKVQALVEYRGLLGRGRTGILMDYYPYGDLNAVSKFSLAQKMQVAHRIILRVHELHKLDMVHKDLKEENILLVVNEKGLDVKIIDLGFLVCNASKKKSESVTFSPAGTATHVAPELIDNRLVADKSNAGKIDAYSVGVILKKFIQNQDDLKKYKKLTKDFVNDLPSNDNGLEVWLNVHKKYGKHLRRSSDPFSRIVGSLLRFVPKKRPTMEVSLRRFEKDVVQAI